jgi:hypothetical protein
LTILEVPAFHFNWDTILVTRPGRSLAPPEKAFVRLVRQTWRGDSVSS